MPRVRPIGQAEQIAYRIPAKVHGVGTPIDVYVLAVVRKLNDVAARIRLSRAVAFWPVQTAVARVVRYGVRRSATLWDGFVGSNVGFFADRDRASV
jgi:hypothetical protein